MSGCEEAYLRELTGPWPGLPQRTKVADEVLLREVGYRGLRPVRCLQRYGFHIGLLAGSVCWRVALVHERGVQRQVARWERR